MAWNDPYNLLFEKIAERLVHTDGPFEAAGQVEIVPEEPYADELPSEELARRLAGTTPRALISPAGAQPADERVGGNEHVRDVIVVVRYGAPVVAGNLARAVTGTFDVDATFPPAPAGKEWGVLRLRAWVEQRLASYGGGDWMPSPWDACVPGACRPMRVRERSVAAESYDFTCRFILQV